MKISAKKLAIYGSVVVFLIVAVGLGSRPIIFGIVRKKLDEKIEALRQQGIVITYDSIYSNLSDCNLCVKNIIVRLPVSDTSCSVQPTEAHIGSIEVQGLKILPLILRKRISLGSIKIEHPVIHYTKKYRGSPAKDGEKKEAAIKGFLLDSLIITHPEITFYDSATCDTLRHFASNNIDVTGISLSGLDKDSLVWEMKDFASSEILAELPTAMYTIRVKSIGYSSASLELKIDSTTIVPDYEKLTFVRKAGKQTDRIACNIPELLIQEFEPELLQQSKIQARFVRLSINADIYRDKRIARVPQKPTSLPVKFLRDFPFAVRIDSMEMAESNIVYEEFPETGDQAGKISFEKLTAKIYNITNRVGESARMEAKALLMGSGSLNVTFTFPAKADGAYTAKGTLRNFAMPALNRMLTPLANAEIRSGTLNEMAFDFKYNEYRSDGQLFMDYKDLQLISLQKDDKTKSNKLVSFLISLFVKKDMDKDTAVDKKTGTILFYRDDQRAIFNYWWKSLLSGIKSVYNVDKLTNADGKKEVKK